MHGLTLKFGWRLLRVLTCWKLYKHLHCWWCSFSWNPWCGGFPEKMKWMFHKERRECENSRFYLSAFSVENCALRSHFSHRHLDGDAIMNPFPSVIDAYGTCHHVRVGKIWLDEVHWPANGVHDVGDPALRAVGVGTDPGLHRQVLVDGGVQLCQVFFPGNGER